MGQAHAHLPLGASHDGEDLALLEEEDVAGAGALDYEFLVRLKHDGRELGQHGELEGGVVPAHIGSRR